MTSAPRKPPTVLIVDDETGLRRVLERFLDRNGYRVLSVGTAEAAYEALGSETADALLLDIHLPTMSGLALYLAIIHRWPALEGHIAIMTGDAEAEEVRTWLEQHHCMVIRKPFNLRHVAEWISSVLQRNRSTGAMDALDSTHADPLFVLREYRNRTVEPPDLCRHPLCSTPPPLRRSTQLPAPRRANTRSDSTSHAGRRPPESAVPPRLFYRHFSSSWRSSCQTGATRRDHQGQHDRTGDVLGAAAGCRHRCDMTGCPSKAPGMPRGRSSRADSVADARR
jgi:CheY-like chemotaxis protein